MLFWNKICGFVAIFLFFANCVSAQTSKNKIFSGEVFQKKSDKAAFTIIPQDYYTQHFGIICKKELALEKITKIPFRFRLGSLQQCNYLEGKK